MANQMEKMVKWEPLNDMTVWIKAWIATMQKRNGGANVLIDEGLFSWNSVSVGQGIDMLKSLQEQIGSLDGGKEALVKAGFL